jgi:hypothetical protein
VTRLGAPVALVDMTAQRSRPADLDGAHQTQLMTRQAMTLPVGLAVLSKNAGWPGHLWRLLLGTSSFPGRGRRAEGVQRRDGLGQPGGSHGCVTSRGVDALVTQQHLDDANVFAVFQQMSGEAVAQDMRSDALGQARSMHGLPARILHRTLADVSISPPRGEQPLARRPHRPIVGAQDGQQTGRQHRQPRPLPLAVFDVQVYRLSSKTRKFRRRGNWSETNEGAKAAPQCRRQTEADPVVRLPGVNNWDLTAYKNFVVKERFRTQFRAEFYNAFNHTQFTSVDSTARFDAQLRQVNTQFGQVTATRPSRRIQLALRFSF